MRPYLLLGLELFAPFLLAIGCDSVETAEQSTGAGGASASSGATSSSSSSGAGQPDAGGDPSHPPGDGKHISEADACNLLSDARVKRRLALNCGGASLTCPDLLRPMFMTPCLEYDRGSVQGCIYQYFAAATCEALLKSFDECTITAFPDSQPNGCPGQ
jgi:hypothetical protein